MAIKYYTLWVIICMLALCSACSAGGNAQAAADIAATSSPTITISISKTPLQPVLPSATPTSTATLLPSATLQPTATPIPSFTSVPSPTPIPDEHYITGIVGHRQSYSISCESSSAADWANFFGLQTYESQIQFSLPQSDNPDLGFVGNVNDPWGQIPPYSYGVHAEPLADVLREDFGLPARAEKGFTLDEIKAEIAADQPVIAWVIGNMVAGYPTQYQDSLGNTTIVAPYEHTVILTGYSSQHIRYLNNGNFYEIPIDIFLTSWGVLGNMVIFYNESH